MSVVLLSIRLHIPKSASYDIANHRPFDPMEAVVSRALLVKHADAPEPLWLCMEGFVHDVDAGSTTWQQHCLPKMPRSGVRRYGS